MLLAAGANLQFGTPDPLNEFDDLVLPQALFQLSMMLTMVTMVLQIYRILCFFIIYRAARQEKSYWRKLKEEFYDENYSIEQRKKHGGGGGQRGLKPAKLHSLKAEMSLGMMNWLERLMDPLVSTLMSKSTLQSVSLSGQGSTGSSLKTDMMTIDSSGNSTFGQQLAQQSIVGSKTESDVQVINYLLRMEKEHECELCSITEGIDAGKFSSSMINQGFHLMGTVLGEFFSFENLTSFHHHRSITLQVSSRRCAPTIKSSSTCAAQCIS